MFIEEKGTARRKNVLQEQDSHLSDISFLKNYYSENGKFPMFSQILLETRTDCNRKCKFCPQSHLSRPLRIMEWSIFENVINQLSNIGFSGRIAFFMTNEPLLEERLLEMIKFARNRSSRFFLDITTNGQNLTVKLIEDFFRAGLDNININDYRSDRKKYPHKISAQISDVISAFKSNPKVTYNKRSTIEVLSNYAGVIPGSKRRLESSFCNYPFRKLAVSAAGNIILCCNDYSYKSNFGNVIENTLISIWYSEQLNHYRHNLLNGIRNGICSGCDAFQDYSIFT